MGVFVVGIVIVALAALVFIGLTFARRDREKAIGYVSRETARRDKSNPAAEDLAEDLGARDSREVERSAVLARRGGEIVPASPAPVAVREPLDEDALGVTRRQFLNRGITGMMAFSISGFGAACLAFLWPQLSGGFGSKIRAGNRQALLDTIATTRTPVYFPEGRFYLNPYPTTAVPKAKGVTSYAAVVPGYEAGLVALYQKCVHLGCRVPWCETSQWFECPCHGSKYNRVGEKRDGPAPRGMDRFVVSLEGDTVVVDTLTVIPGPPLGTDTTGQQPEGPFCA
jgi:cytochrome b6-f complex iron-sulfur subunit